MIAIFNHPFFGGNLVSLFTCIIAQIAFVGKDTDLAFNSSQHEFGACMGCIADGQLHIERIEMLYVLKHLRSELYRQIDVQSLRRNAVCAVGGKTGKDTFCIFGRHFADPAYTAGIFEIIAVIRCLLGHCLQNQFIQHHSCIVPLIILRPLGIDPLKHLHLIFLAQLPDGRQTFRTGIDV